MFIYRKDKRKFKWLIFSFILVLGLGGYGLVYACSEQEKKQIMENEQAFCKVLVQVAVDKAVHETQQAFIAKLRASLKKAREYHQSIELNP